MKRKVFAMFTIILFAQFTFAYKQEDVDKFNKTGICINCDLSATTIHQKTEGPINIRGSNISHSFVYLHNDAESSNLSDIIAIRSRIRVSAAHLNLRNARLSESNLGDANLMYADFTGAHLDGVDLFKANLYGAKGISLSEPKTCLHAVLPNGDIPKEDFCKDHEKS